MATSRTYTTSSTGSYGQYIPFLRPDADRIRLQPGAARELLHIENTSAFRTNAGAINPNIDDATLRFTLFDAGGQALSVIDRILKPLQAVQFPINRPVAGGRLEVELIGSRGNAISWASII